MIRKDLNIDYNVQTINASYYHELNQLDHKYRARPTCTYVQPYQDLCYG
jgi:hypothetical protein